MKYEGSKLDMARDKKQAKKHGMSLKAWERSDMDKEEDLKGQAEMNRKHQPHHFAHKMPRM